MTVTRVMRTLARLVVLVAGIALLPAALAVERDPDSHFFMPFLGDLRDELGEARTDGRKGLLVMYHFEACPSCQRMRREVLNRPEVQDWYRRTFRPIAIDIRGAQPITDLNGKTQSERAYGRAVKIRGTPTFDFYALDGARVYRHVGGLFEPADFLLLGRFVAIGAYNRQSFEDFRQATQKGS